MKIKNIANQIVSTRKRKGVRANKTYMYIGGFLRQSSVKFHINKYQTFVPKILKTKLTADAQAVASKGSSFISGKIDNNFKVFTGFHSNIKTLKIPNINTNLKSKSISRPNFYFAPSISINRKDLPKVKNAKNIQGQILVKKQRVLINQILVGNTKNPKNIIFSHYDSIDTGALDNASGVAVSLSLISNHKNILRDSLFVIDGNEELSYDYPIYWGHGYRVFETKYKSILKKCKKIIIIDCVGNGDTKVTSNKKILKSAFPIRSINSVINKTCTLHGNIDNLFQVYHSEADTVENLKERYLQDAAKTLISLIN